MSGGATALTEVRQVPFLPTIIQSFRFVFTNLRAVVFIGWLPLLIFAAVSGVKFYMVTDLLDGNRDIPAAIEVPADVASWVGYALLAVGWHRFVLLGERHSAAAGLLARRNFVFLAFYLVLIASPMLVWDLPMQFICSTESCLNLLASIGEQVGMSPGDVIASFIWAAAFVAYAIKAVLVRFYLVFPAIAIGQKLKLREAWRRMHGNSWRLIGALVVAALVVGLPPAVLRTYLLQPLLEAGSAEASGTTLHTSWAIYFVLSPAVTVLMTAVLVTILSRFYLHIISTAKRRRPPPDDAYG